MRVLVLNGPNLDRLGARQPDLYGTTTLAEIEADLQAEAARQGVQLTCRQSNHEGVLVDMVHAAAADHDGIVLNAGAYTHTSVALRDALLAVDLPLVEVHLTNPARRAPLRRRSHTADLAVGVVAGFGAHGYRLALDALLHTLRTRRPECIRPTNFARD